MGEDIGLLSYLPDDEVRKALFVDTPESGGHPLHIRILFGKTEQEESSPSGVWALPHSKPDSSCPPECRLKIFSRRGEPEEPIALEEVMVQASPIAAFTCLKAQHGRFDPTHLSSVFRHYFIL